MLINIKLAILDQADIEKKKEEPKESRLRGAAFLWMVIRITCTCIKFIFMYSIHDVKCKITIWATY